MKKSSHISFGSVFVFSILSIFFILYTYTQLDLNLTLYSNSYYQLVQEQLLMIGYYQRPISALLVATLFVSLTIFYVYTLVQIINKKFHLRKIIVLIGITALLVFAYPAFSHDIFNYMFDARIVTKYHLHPQYFRALDFPDDTWTRFMRWTHRYYPYGPAWLVISLVPVFIRSGKFVATLFLFKSLFLLFHLANCFLIYKIVRKMDMSHPLLRLGVFALNPLVLTESIVSPHNEVMMLTCVLVSYYSLLHKRVFFSMSSLIFSVLVKYVSAVLIPLFLLFPSKVSENLKWSPYVWIVALIPVIMTHELYSWYFVPVIALLVLGPLSPWKLSVIVGGSLALLVRYIPYIFVGDYTVLTRTLETWLIIGTFIVVTCINYFFIWLKRNL